MNTAHDFHPLWETRLILQFFAREKELAQSTSKNGEHDSPPALYIALKIIFADPVISRRCKTNKNRPITIEFLVVVRLSQCKNHIALCRIVSRTYLVRFDARDSICHQNKNCPSLWSQIYRRLVFAAAWCSHVSEPLYRNHATVNQPENVQCQFICFYVPIAVPCRNIHSLDD